MRLTARGVLLLGGIAFAMVAYLFSPYHGKPFPFGAGVSWAALSVCALSLCTAIWLHKEQVRRVILYAFLFGAVSGTITLIAGLIWGLFVSNENLGPLVGLFTTGPVGFAAGTVIGVCAAIARLILKVTSKKRQSERRQPIAL